MAFFHPLSVRMLAVAAFGMLVSQPIAAQTEELAEHAFQVCQGSGALRLEGSRCIASLLTAAPIATAASIGHPDPSAQNPEPGTEPRTQNPEPRTEPRTLRGKLPGSRSGRGGSWCSSVA